MLQIALDRYEFGQFDYGRDVTCRIYDEALSTFDATGYTAVAKVFQDTQALFVAGYRNVATGFGFVHPEGQVSQIVEDRPITFTDESNGVGTFSFSQTARPARVGIMWIEIELTKSGSQLSTERKRITVIASPGSN